MFPLLIRIIILSIFVTIIFVVPAFLMYFLGYKPRHDKLDAYVNTTCYVLNHDIKKTSCAYQCNCQYDINNRYECETCYNDCYDGYVEVIYIIDNKKYDIIKLTINRSTSVEVASVLDRDAPIDKYIPCRYRKKDHGDITFDEEAKIDNTRAREKEQSFYLGFIFFCIMGTMIIFTWLLGEIGLCVKKWCTNNE